MIIWNVLMSDRPLNKEKTAMTNAALRSWLLISLLAMVAMLVGRTSAHSK